MTQPRSLILPCSLLLVLLLAAPVIAATGTCPSDCSCLLPADAKKAGSPGYCNGKQAVCGYDALKNEKYCFEKTATTTTTVPQLVITGVKPVVTTTATTKPVIAPVTTTSPLVAGPTRITPASCPATCECIPDEKAQGAAVPLSLCGDTKTWCGDTAAGVHEYCYSVPETATTTTTPPALRTRTEPCGSGCTCLSYDKAEAIGLKRCPSTSTLPCSFDPVDRPMWCYPVPETSATTKAAVAATTTTPATTGTTLVPMRLDITPGANAAAPAPNMFSSFSTFVATLFGGRDAVSAGSAGSSTIRACPFGTTLCDGECVRLSSDTENCGGCRNTCPGQLPLCCDGTCSSMISAENCHTCGNTCTAAEPCTMVSGWPVCSPAGCEGTPRSTDCGTGVCIDLDWDSSNCGACGNACPAHSECRGGTCTPCPSGTDRCGNGTLASGGVCTSLSSHFNCGACGAVCAPGTICEGSTCVSCPSGKSWCGGDNCIDLQSSYYSCGSCGHWCNQTLPTLESCCGGQCSDLRTNSTNCGTCGNTCGENQRCIAGTCALMPTGTVEATCWLGQTACGMTCTNLESDEFNCGACGQACMSGRVCIDGACLMAGGEDGCGLGQIRCGGQCVYPETNRDNCGRCGHVCPGWYTCRGSTCTPAYSGDEAICEDPGLDYCSGECADLRTNERNCGACGNDCTGGSCIEGTCYYLDSDRANCGSIGHRCASGEICCSGTCRAENTGDPDRCACSSAPCRASDGLGCCNGYCWALNTDSANCGACGHVCEDGDRCCGSRCTDIWWDEDNCGRCGHECPWNKECQNGHCCLWGTTWGCD